MRCVAELRIQFKLKVLSINMALLVPNTITILIQLIGIRMIRTIILDSDL